MRFLALSMALALAACGAPAGAGKNLEAELAGAAVKAYRAGDRTALRAALDGYARLEPAAPPASCSDAAYQQRRVSYMREKLALLDNPTVFGMSEEARFLHLSLSLIGGGDPRALDYDPACEAQPDFRSMARSDNRKLMAITKAMTGPLSEWGHALKAKSPSDVEARLKQASQQLEANNIS